MKSNWVRAGAVGAVLLSSLVAVDLMGAPTDAQTMGTGPIAFPGADSGPVVSDDALVVAFQSDSVDGAGAVTGSTIALFRRDSPPSGTNPAPIPGSSLGVRPGISGDGCVVAWSIDGDGAAPAVAQSPLADPADAADGPAGLDPVADPDVAVEPDVAVDPEAAPDPATPGQGPGVAVEALQATAGARLVVVDRCAAAAPVEIAVSPDAVFPDVATATARLAAPALSLDGSVIAVSSGQEIVVLRRNAAGVYVRSAAVDGTAAPTSTRLTDDHVDVSDDGSVVLFSAGPQATPATRDVMRFQSPPAGGPGATTLLLAGATHPGVSGDATVVVAAQGPQVVVAPLPASGPIPPASLATLGAGFLPVISGDGNHVVFDTTNAVAIRSWTGADAAPFAQVDDRTIPGVTRASRSGPAIDRYGTLVATDVALPDPTVDTELLLTTIVADIAFGSSTYDLGVGDVGAELAATLDVTNDGPASYVIDTVTVGGTFVVEPGSCGGVLRPGTTCSFDVSFTVERLEDAVADVTVTGLLLGSGSVSAVVEALGRAPATTTSTTTSTVPSGSTTGGGTSGGSTGGATTGGTSTSGTTGSTGSTTGRTTTSTTGRTTTSTTGRTTTSTTGRTTTTTTTTTTLPAGSGLTISPASFDFVPTIIDSGVRTGAVEVVNSASTSASIDVVALRGDVSFEVGTDGCSGVVLAEGERCAITIDFAPTDVGEFTAEVAVLVAGGRELTAALSGVGAAQPQLSVTPDAAQSGQVVTVRGAGFPTGASVDLVVNGDVQTVVVDSSGSFTQPVVIMANTSSGPLDIVATAMGVDFDDVSTSLVVRSTADRSGSSVLRGAGIDLGR